MTTNVSIASQTLLLLRANTISSFADDSNEGEIMNEMYDEHIKSLFSLHPWTFATKKRMLSQDSTAPINEYTYSHIIPAEALLIWAVFNSDQVGAIPVRDYDIYGTASSRRIFSNHPALYADYTIYADENIWPGYFTQFAINSLAAYTAYPITGNADLATYYHQKAYGSASGNMKAGMLGVAIAQDSKQKRNETLFSAPLVEARFS